MSDLRARPKANFIKETDWQELYVLTNHWKSDLLFFKDDLKFMHRLIDKYFIWITEEGNLHDVQKIGNAILKNTQVCDGLLKSVQEHLSHLANLIDEPFKNDSGKFRDEHQELEDDITLFTKSVRDNRKELFSVTERVLNDERLENMMRR